MNTPETQDGSQGCLVIIDDIPENLILLTRTLTQHGYKIRAATTGAMGLETIRAEPPDLVLLDLMLPDLDGYEVCRQLKQDPTCATIPVIFLTARNKTDDVVRAFEAGGVDYVSKPFHLEELLARIATHIRLRRADNDRSRIERRLHETQRLESLVLVAAGISHDFNNLLTVILGNAELVRNDLPAESRQVNLLLQIEEAGQRAARLCGQMLAYSGRSHFQVELIDLNGLINEAASVLRHTLPARAVLRMDLSPDVPRVMIDRAQMRQVLTNLVHNAGEALINGSGTVTLRTSACQANREMLSAFYLSPDLPAGDYVSLEVIDDGCGISEQTQSRIFDPFFTTKFLGRGLGLAAVLGIIRSHNGTIQVESEVNKGSCFRILLPTIPTPTHSVAEPPAVEQADKPGLILIVDDEASVRRLIARQLEDAGYPTFGAGSGQEALTYLRQSSPPVSLILLDLTMPEMDGVETFARIQQITQTIPVLLMSGYNEQQALVRFKHGLAGFVQKPFTRQDMLGKVKTALRKK